MEFNKKIPIILFICGLIPIRVHLPIDLGIQFCFWIACPWERGPFFVQMAIKESSPSTEQRLLRVTKGIPYPKGLK